ncbi:MAG: DUF362 domain-containing protein [Synergistaceae bacterium]|jgi:uncharacterized protein (DUF362 family)/Pyruvate/2-oxoacid:ferredoxin oxidoreductase delta subunit|nr:DUF362 domain-containing protein [Synergistaceae bacterium]
MNFVAGVAKCQNYEREEVERSMTLAVERAGGMPDIAPREVLVKANMLSPSEPELAVTTHPEILRAIAGEIRKTCDFPIRIADNPGYIFTDAGSLLEKTGINGITGIEGVTAGLLSDMGIRDVRRDSFRALDSARISARYLDAGFCVNAAKLKTHVETEISGCIKNIFGTADIGTRKKCHSSPSQKRLADAIVDLYSIRPPEFNVLDAVVGMEGDGPSHGQPRQVGYIVAGRNALAVDWVASAIMGYDDPLCVPLMASAAERGIGPRARTEIVLNGADWDELPVKGFKKSSGLVRAFPTFLRGFVHKLVSISPKLDKRRCLGCGICRNVCPVDAISDAPGPDGKKLPAIDRLKCVSCLCCHEMCPTGAMTAHKNLLARLAEASRF